MQNSSGDALGARLGSLQPRSRLHPSAIGLRFKALGLPNMDRRSEGYTDAYVIVQLQDDLDPSVFKEIGRTETVYNSLNPAWAKSISVPFNFGEKRLLRFLVFDKDPDRDEYIGQVVCALAHILLAPQMNVTKDIYNPRLRSTTLFHTPKPGSLVVSGELEERDMGESTTLQFGCSHLRNVKRPFFRLCRQQADRSFAPVRYSEVLKDYLHDPARVNKYNPFTTNLVALCNGERQRVLKLEFFDYDKRGKHRLSCDVLFSLQDLIDAYEKADKSGVNARFAMYYRTQRTGTTESGCMTLFTCTVQSSDTFIDYITKGGIVLNTVFAIDMSATNGNPADSNSLQYNNPNGENEYVRAIEEVGKVLEDYDSTRSFPAWGFGACLPPDFTDFSRCFPLSNDPNGVCSQISGVVSEYRSMLPAVAPFGPCEYAPVVNRVIQQTAQDDIRSGHGVYTILVLLTDGSFVDFSSVADSICRAAELPLSIVIVGIGQGNMSLLEKLDGDDSRLCDSNGVPASRDIVQFVPFSKHRGQPANIAKEVLAEIPEQLCSYFRSRGIRPGDQRRPGSVSAAATTQPAMFAAASAVLAPAVSRVPPRGDTHWVRNVTPIYPPSATLSLPDSLGAMGWSPATRTNGRPVGAGSFRGVDSQYCGSRMGNSRETKDAARIFDMGMSSQYVYQHLQESMGSEGLKFADGHVGSRPAARTSLVSPPPRPRRNDVEQPSGDKQDAEQGVKYVAPPERPGSYSDGRRRGSGSETRWRR